MYHFARAIKLYGNVIGDKNMQHRGDLMLAIMKRSVNMYMLYTRDNKIQPQTLLATKYRVFYLRIKSIMPLTSGEVLLEMNGFMVFICCPLHQCLLTLEARNLLKRNGMKIGCNCRPNPRWLERYSYAQ